MEKEKILNAQQSDNQIWILSEYKAEVFSLVVLSLPKLDYYYNVICIAAFCFVLICFFIYFLLILLSVSIPVETDFSYNGINREIRSISLNVTYFFVFFFFTAAVSDFRQLSQYFKFNLLFGNAEGISWHFIRS